ncbi:MAG: PAS domain S-box protein, partial [Thermoanaerobaculia bacterium]
MRTLRAYGLSLGALGAAIALRWAVDPVLGDALPFVTLFAAVAVAVWIGGYRVAVAIAILGFVASDYLFMTPRGRFDLSSPAIRAGLFAYLFTCAIIVAIGEAMRRERARAQDRGELLRVTLASIGDGVIAADNAGQVTYLNTIAEQLTGWSTTEALGEPLERVFQLAHEADNRPFEDSGAFTPSGERVVRAGHAVLLSKDGSVRPVDHGIAPIRDEAGAISGRVAVFRDISVRRRTEQAETQRMLTARELAAIVETSDDAIISKSLEGV